jgi:dTDP-4-amino-4,6-dideoxygalactose transaminase
LAAIFLLTGTGGEEMQIPFSDLTAQYLEARKEIDAAWQDVVSHSAFIGGEPVKRFEAELAASMGLKYACGVASGTAALAITMKSLDLGPGDEVITTVHTAAPTAEAITLAGARIVFCDIEEDTFQIDPKAIEAAITPRTRALLPVHLYGLSARLRDLTAIARKHKLVLIEDVAQAQGTRYDGRPVGTYGMAGCLSFFPSKNLGGFGDGGAVVTNDERIERFVRMYSNHGRLAKFDHTIQGANERLDALQAALMLPKLRRLEKWNERRRKAAQWYEERLSDIEELRLPHPVSECTPTWHLYVVRIKNRDKLATFLKEKGVQTGLHYPLPLNLQPAFESLGKPAGSFPVAERLTQHEILSLPMFPHITEEQVDYVCRQIREYVATKLKRTTAAAL